MIIYVYAYFVCVYVYIIHTNKPVFYLYMHICTFLSEKSYSKMLTVGNSSLRIISKFYVLSVLLVK